MKTIFRNLGLGILMAGCLAFTGSRAFAQDAPAADVCKDVEGQQALYKQFTDNIVKGATLEQRGIAVKAGEDYVQKYGACPESKDIVAYMNTNLPKMKEGIAKSKQDIIDQQAADANQKLLNRFDTAVKGTNNAANPSETYAAGKDIVALNNDFQLDVLLVLGSVGFDQASAATPVDTYNNDTIEYAKAAIQKLEANTPSKTKNYGVYGYSYKTDKLANGQPNPNGYADGRNNALGAMNYNIGYILYFRQGKDNPAKKKEALPYLYKATQYNSYTKKNPSVYQAIGASYLDEAIRVDKERAAKLAANGNKDNDETLAMVGEQKGYADRAIDAYSRAYKLAKANPKTGKDYTDNLYAKLTDLYKFRYDGDTKGIDAFVAKVDATPFPDPTTPITPVKIEPTAPTTTSTTDPTKPATTPPATTPPTKPGTKPAATTPTKPATTPTTGATKPAGTSNVDATTDGKAPVKKVVPKKKGTR